MAASTTVVTAASTTVAADKPSFFQNLTDAFGGRLRQVRDLTAENFYDFRAKFEVKDDDNILVKVGKVFAQVLATLVLCIPAIVLGTFSKVKNFVCTSTPAASAAASATTVASAASSVVPAAATTAEA